MNCAIENYSHEIAQLLTLSLKKFAAGFALQKGAIFGFGDNAEKDTGTVLKISNLNDVEMKELDNAQVHNLSEERLV